MKNIFGIIIFWLGIQSAAHAIVITAMFDEFGGHQRDTVGKNYLGLKWTGIGVISDRISGNSDLAVSGESYGYAWCCGHVDSISTFSGTFDFIGGFFSTPQLNPSDFTIRGFVNGIETYTQTVSVTGSPVWIELNLLGIDKVVFDSKRFANITFDDLVFSVDESFLVPWQVPAAIPESQSIVLVAIGLLALYGRRARSSLKSLQRQV